MTQTTSQQVLNQWWEAWMRTALLGSERQTALPPLPEDVPLAQMLADIYPDNIEQPKREQQYLQTAAVLALYCTAGTEPEMFQGELLSPDTAKSTGPWLDKACMHLLLRLMEDTYHDYREHFIRHWAQLAEARALPIAPPYLPFFLDTAKKHQVLYRTLPVLLDQRGQWLVATNKAWQPLVYYLMPSVASAPDVRLWEEGDLLERERYLKYMRQHDPEKAREALQEVWSKEHAKTRTHLLATFQYGLSLADEPFLEQCLDDRAKDVRALARDLLAALPESAFSQRHKARLTTWITLKPEKGKGPKFRLELTLPTHCPSAWARDGIGKVRPRTNRSQSYGGWWLFQSLCFVPLDFWSELWQQEPEVLLQALKGDKDPGRDIARGWLYAFQHYPCSEKWQQAMVEHLDTLSPNSSSYERWMLLDWGAKDDASYEAAMLGVFTKATRKHNLWSHKVYDALSTIDPRRPLSTLWERVLQLLQEHIQQAAPPKATAHSRLVDIGRLLSLLIALLPYDHLQTFEAMFRTSTWHDLLEPQTAQLHLRHSIQETFTSPPKEESL